MATVKLPGFQPVGAVDLFPTPQVSTAPVAPTFAYNEPLGTFKDGKWLIDIDKMRKTKTCFLTPLYGGQIQAKTWLSYMHLANRLTSLGIPYGLRTCETESLIPRARNVLQALALSDPEVTHLMWIDGDTTFRTEDFLRMLCVQLPIVGGLYPKKGLSMERICEAYEQGLPPDKLLQATAVYPINIENQQLGWGHRIERGMHQALMLATGNLLVERRVVELMMSRNPQLKLRNTSGLPEGAEDFYYSLFDTDILDGSYLSEDYYFCLKAKEAGVDCYMDADTRVEHIGPMLYLDGSAQQKLASVYGV